MSKEVVLQLRLSRGLIALVALVAALAVSGTAVLAQSEQTIYGCYDRKSGDLRVVGGPNNGCKEGEKKISWNQKGAKGEPGPVGPAGPDGGDAGTLDGKDSSEFLGSSDKAADSDKLDGQDSTAFMPFTTYQREILTSGQGEANATNSVDLTCFAGDKLLSGGVNDVDDSTSIVENFPANDETTWEVEWINGDVPDQIGIAVLCADVQ